MNGMDNTFIEEQAGYSFSEWKVFMSQKLVVGYVDRCCFE